MSSVDLLSQTHFHHYTLNNGLPHQNVQGIDKDSEGFLWFNTGAGLMRFDGYKFSSLSELSLHFPGDKLGEVSCFLPDDSAHIWIGTPSQGVWRYRVTDGTFRQFRCSAYSPDTQENAIRSLYRDKKGVLWVGTTQGAFTIDQGLRVSPVRADLFGDAVITDFQEINGQTMGISVWKGGQAGCGIYYLDNETQQATPIPELRGKPCIKLAKDLQGGIWVGTVTGIYYGEDDTWEKLKLDPAYYQKINAEPQIYSIGVHTEQQVHIGTFMAGLKIYDCEHHQVEEGYADVLGKYKELIVNDTYRDVNGNIWVATTGFGCFKFTDKAEPYTPEQRPDLPIQSHWKGIEVNKFLEDSHENIWIGGKEKLSLFTHEGTLIKDIPLPGIHIIDFVLDEGEQAVWIATWGKGVLRYDLKKGLYDAYPLPSTNAPHQSASFVFSIFKSREGDIWVGNWSGGLNKLNPQTLTFERQPLYLRDMNDPNVLPSIRTMFQSRAGELWMGTMHNGLLQYNTHTQACRQYVHNSNNVNSMSHNDVISLVVDKAERLWIGTNGKGINILDVRTAHIIRIGEQDGISNDMIKAVTLDKDSNVWVATQTGINLITDPHTIHDDSPDRILIHKFNLSGDRPDAQYITGALHYSSSGILYCGNKQGVRQIKRDIHQNKYVNGPIVFTNISLANEPLLPKASGLLTRDINQTRTIHIPYEQSNFSIQFASLDYTAPERNEYVFMMEGLENQWTYLGNKNSVTYGGLQQGNYRFNVRATNSYGQWIDQVKQIQIVVLPPWWLTGYAFAAYILILLIVLILARRMILYRERLRNKIQLQEMELGRNAEIYAAKTSFITHVTHEFKTPLTLIIAPLENMLQKFRKQGEGFQDLAVANRNAKRLLKLVQEMLDFQLLEEEEKLRITHTNFDLHEAVDEIVKDFMPLAKQRNLRLAWQSELTHSRVRSDRGKIEHILYNLISNAIRYTPDYGVVEVTLISEGKAAFMCTVRDTGVGIAEHKLPHIFEKFYTGDTLHKASMAGSGVGLYYVKELVALLGGRIKVESNLNEGSSFTVRLPLEIVEDTLSTSALYQNSYSPPTPLKDISILYEDADIPQILLIDDNVELLTFISETLGKSFRVHTVRYPEKAIEAIEQVNPQVIISDLMMPGLDGVTLCKQVKMNPVLSHIPFILLTADASEQSQLEGYEFGADAYITKPFNMQILIKRIHNLINSREAIRNTYKKIALGDFQHAALNQRDEKFLESLKEIMKQNVSNPELTSSTLARLLGLSRTQLYKKMEAMLGISVNDFINTYRLNHAKELMKTDMNMADISYAIGCSSPAQFSRIFKKYHHITPTAYRTQEVRS